MKYVLHMFDNNGNRQLELLDTTTDPIAEIEKNLNDREDLAGFRFYIPKEQYDYEVGELKKAQDKLARVRYELTRED
jgi:hypothetical protein